MSSYICNPKHFNTVNHNLKLILKRQSHDRYNHELKELLFLQDSIDIFINTIKELQVNCVILQYKHHYTDVDNQIKLELAEVNKKTPAEQISELQLINALKCINYQIEIEHLTELRKLTLLEQTAYDILEKLIDKLSHAHVSNLIDENDNIKWEIS